MLSHVEVLSALAVSVIYSGTNKCLISSYFAVDGTDRACTVEPQTFPDHPLMPQVLHDYRLRVGAILKVQCVAFCPNCTRTI